MGAGQVTIRRRGREVTYPAGDAFALEQLSGANSVGFSTETVHEPAIDWSECLEDDAASEEPFIELLVQTRAQLRAAEQWVLADDIRERLAGLGVILEDGQTETTWRRA